MRTDQKTLRAAAAELSAPGTRKFAVAKALLEISEKDPEKLYPLFEPFRSLMTSPNSIVKWTAFRVLGNLVASDHEGRFDGVLGRYLRAIRGPEMITAAHAIAGAARIAAARKDLAPRMIRGILKVETASYRTPECRHIAMGHALVALRGLEADARPSASVSAFAARQLRNPRPATRRKAEQCLARNPRRGASQES